MDMDNWEQQPEKKPAPNKRDFSVVKVKNAITGEIMFMPKYKLNEFNHRIDSDGTIIYIPEKIPDKSRGERGCLIFILAFLASLATIGGVIVKREFKANKKHPNTISCIYEKDKKIVISDVDTKEERIIEYNGYKDKFAKQNKLPEFEKQVKLSNIGDTVMFVSSNYDTRRKFVLDTQNRLYLNKDSILSRTQKQR
jgi:hypothetical protein